MSTTDTSTLELTAERDGKRQRVTVKQGEKPLHIDTLNLSSAPARGKFLDALAAKFEGLDRDDLDAKLMALAASGSKSPAEGNDDADPLAGTPGEMIEEANQLLRDPELLRRITDDIAAVGVAGERELAMTVYLIGVSRLLPTPLAGIIRGSSSSGKSYTVNKVAELFPPEAVIHATQMTPQALFHMKPGSLRHKWVVAGERSRVANDDTAEATRALREMLASRRLSKLMPVKLGNGIETQLIEQEGPIAFTETTTLANIFEEDANRCLLLQTDETPEQTKRILRAFADSHGEERANTERILRVHHTLQRLLQPRSVRVPWSDRLAEKFNCERVEMRRAFPQLLALVSASALLHHRQRNTGNDGAILADARDYHLGRRLLSRPFAQSLGGGLSDSTLAFLGKLPTGEEFTAKETANRFKVSKSSASAWLSELHDAGAVEVTQEGRGRTPTKWKRTGKAPDHAENLLPTVESLFPKFAGHTDATQDY